MLPGARASSSGDRRRLDRTSCPGPSMMMPNGFARWRLPRETDHSARTEPACAGKDWCITHPIGQRCTDDQPTIKGRTSANFGYSKPLFAYVHRTFGDQFIASARAIFFCIPSEGSIGFLPLAASKRLKFRAANPRNDEPVPRPP
jgi:hypothetical protein